LTERQRGNEAEHKLSGLTSLTDT